MGAHLPSTAVDADRNSIQASAISLAAVGRRSSVRALPRAAIDSNNDWLTDDPQRLKPLVSGQFEPLEHVSQNSLHAFRRPVVEALDRCCGCLHGLGGALLGRVTLSHERSSYAMSTKRTRACNGTSAISLGRSWTSGPISSSVATLEDQRQPGMTASV